ncbi:MAG: DNA polymerase I [Planctomycetaceae bacterium]|nr:DNA polymerase I [Planctomycetaceae bacterium]
MSNDCIYLIDTFSLMFQVFHAIPPMTGTRGQPTNAVFGFTRDIMAMLNQKPTHILCAMDSPGEGTRNSVYEAYKANRDEMPDDLRPQIPLIKQVLEGLRIPAVQHEGWEADDVIATVARMATEQGLDVVIVSADKDLRQLIGPKVRIFNVRKGTYMDEQGLVDDWGIRPDQVIDYQSLVGDSVDNIPGVPKVGPKTARTLIEMFGSLDNILANADKAPGKKLSENLVQFADQARVSRELVTLNTQLPLELKLDDARVCDPDHAALLELFTDLGFRRLAAEMRDAVSSEDSLKAVERVVEVLTDVRQLQSATEALWRNAAEVTWSAGYAGNSPRDHHWTSVTFAFDDQKTFHVPLHGDGSSFGKLLDVITQQISSFSGTIITDDGKKLNHALLRRGLQLRGTLFDVSVVDYLLDAGERSHDLENVALRRAIPNPLLSSRTDAAPRQMTMFDDAPDEDAGRHDSRVHTLQILRPAMKNALEECEQVALYSDLEEPLIGVLAEMEFTGIRVDTNELQQQSRSAAERIELLTEQIYGEAGRTFNIDSPKQLSELLFDQLGLPVIKKTKTGASTDQEVLEKLSEVHPLPRMITERRHLTKLKSTYLDALPRMVHPDTGRIHTTFHQTVAATGRLSSSDPNLQNIPIRTDEGRQIRKAFVAGSDNQVLLCADYSQIELRVLAHFSHDQALLEAFRSGKDIHTAVAAEVFHVAEDSVTSDQRRMAKAVNFGVIYGQSPFGLAAALNIGKDEAAAFIQDYFERYPGVPTFCEKILEETLQTGYAKTIMNRRRAITGIRNTTGLNRNMPERTAINTVIQGTAADLIKLAMIRVHSRLKQSTLEAALLMQIHDELVFEVRHDQAEQLQELVAHEMKHAMDLDVPLEVDISTGINWLK